MAFRVCPDCLGQMKVVDSRFIEKENIIWRRYRCKNPKCEELFHTEERFLEPVRSVSEETAREEQRRVHKLK